MKKNIIRILLVLFFAGCSIFTPMTEEEKRAFQIQQERKDFVRSKSVGFEFLIDAETTKFSTLLLDAHTSFIYTIMLPEVKEVSFLEIEVENGWNIKQIYAPKRDYFWDPISHELLLYFNIPYIYLISNTFVLNADIYGATSTKEFIKTKKIVEFVHKPLQENSQKYLSFKYENSLFSENTDNFIKSLIVEEIQDLNFNRLSPRVQAKISQLKEIHQ